MIDCSLRRRVYLWLEASVGEAGPGRAINLFLIVLISLNVMAVALETVDELLLRYESWFAVFEAVSVLIFGLEYALRLWVCVEDERYAHLPNPRLSYALTAMSLVDLLAILPYFLGVFFSVDLRFLRVLRLLRVFKLTRYSSAMNLLLDVFREESSSLFAGFFILFVLLVLAASGAYLVEHDAQPEKFGSIPAAMWWAVATLTTVGYGDVTPITAAGKVFGALVTVVGVGMAALPAGILASGLATALEHKREKLKRQLWDALEDGELCHREEADLEQLRKTLGISITMATAIREEYEHRQQTQADCKCPECGHKFQACGRQA
ncbi:MAG: ion transporter [Granulosicoccaceae bacterium]